MKKQEEELLRGPEDVAARCVARQGLAARLRDIAQPYVSRRAHCDKADRNGGDESL